MRFHLSRRSILAVVGILAVLVLVIAAWFQSLPEFEQVLSTGDVVDSPETPAPLPLLEEESPGSDMTPMEGLESSKRIVHVPDTRTESPDLDQLWIEDVTGTTVAEFAEQSITKALDGDLEVGLKFRHLQEICSPAYTPPDQIGLDTEVRKMTKFAEDKAAAGAPIPPEGKPYKTTFPVWGTGLSTRVFPNAEQSRSHLNQWQQGCRDLSLLLNDELRNELEKLAREGHVFARHLYALWKPDSGTDQQALDRRLRWQMNAIEFTYANLTEGQVAGVIAFGESYIYALFTDLDLEMGLSLLGAALKCGYESKMIQDQYDLPGILLRGEIEERAERLSAYCR